MDGFHHLKIALAREIVEGDDNIPVSNDITREDIGQSLQNILANKIEEMKQTISLINTKEFDKILESIQNAGIVQFVAVGNTIPVALDGAYKFNANWNPLHGRKHMGNSIIVFYDFKRTRCVNCNF